MTQPRSQPVPGARAPLRAHPAVTCCTRPPALRTLALAATALLAAACSAGAIGSTPPGLPPRGDSVAIRTSRGAYRLTPDGPGWRMELDATYTNRTGRTVYLRSGGGRHPAFTLEKRLDDDTWASAFAPVALLVAAPPLEVAPGASRTDTLIVLASRLGGGAPAFSVDTVPRTYRLVYDAYASATTIGMVARLSDPLPVPARASNPFQVE